MKYWKTLVAASVVALTAHTALAWEERVVAETQAAHGLESWWGKEVVSLDATVIFGGKKIVDGRFTFEAHGPRARYDRADGVSIIFDGETAWVTPADASAPMGRFHVLTWPWFVMAPFKMVGEGITLSEHSVRPYDGEDHYTIKQTFGSDMGDAPDDWYRFFINKKTKRIDAMSYIVTYGSDSDPANKEPSIIRYLDYRDAEGPILSSEYEFWHWDPEANVYRGEQPKGVGIIGDVTYIKSSEADFTVPKDARELTLPKPKPKPRPEPEFSYDDYSRLLETYVKEDGVDYESWFANKDDLEALEHFLAQAALVDVDKMERDEQKAFYINLYNAGMLQVVFENYPLETVSTLGGSDFSIFSEKSIKLGDDLLSLDGVEKGILLKEYFDPRIHWAVNCASESCPPLRAEPFTAKRLEAQLDEQARLFANSDRAARVDTVNERVAYSSLFNWYAADFQGENPAEYLNQYRSDPLPLEYEIAWIEYDWALNVAK